MAPDLLAVGAVAEQAEVSEEDPDAFPVGDRGRRRGSVAVVERLGPRPRRLAPPELRPGLAIERDRVERFAFRGGQEDPLGAQDRRRVAGRDLRAPEEVAVGSHLDRQGARVDGAAAVRSAEARPIGGLGPGELREGKGAQEGERGAAEHATDARPNVGARAFRPACRRRRPGIRAGRQAGSFRRRAPRPRKVTGLRPAASYLGLRPERAGRPAHRQAASSLRVSASGESTQSRSPPQADAQVPCASKACTTFLPLRQRWTSSGPSTRRWARMPRYQRASGVSML